MIKQIKKKEKYKGIENMDNYAFSCLLSDLFTKNPQDLDYYLNKNLKPNFYKENLFIMKRKDVWRKLTITILNSKATKEAIKTLFKSPYIDIVIDQQYLSKIMDNKRFFIYDLSSNSSNNPNTLRIYEFGLYNQEATISESLRSFYSFNIISNLHEICGHLNIQVQNLNSNLLGNSFYSPRIDENNSHFYPECGKIRKIRFKKNN